MLNMLRYIVTVPVELNASVMLSDHWYGNACMRTYMVQDGRVLCSQIFPRQTVFVCLKCNELNEQARPLAWGPGG